MEINNIPAQSMERIPAKIGLENPGEKSSGATASVDKVDQIKFSSQAKSAKTKVDELKQKLAKGSLARLKKMKEAKEFLNVGGHNDKEVIFKTAEKMLESKL